MRQFWCRPDSAGYEWAYLFISEDYLCFPGIYVGTLAFLHIVSHSLWSGPDLLLQLRWEFHGDSRTQSLWNLSLEMVHLHSCWFCLFVYLFCQSSKSSSDSRDHEGRKWDKTKQSKIKHSKTKLHFLKWGAYEVT